MLNSQPSILGQQPVPIVGTNAHQYNGTQFAPPPEQPVMHQPSPGWGAVPAASQAMPMMGNHPYMPPGSMPQMGPGMMHMPGQGGVPHPGTMPPARPDHMQ